MDKEMNVNQADCLNKVGASAVFEAVKDNLESIRKFISGWSESNNVPQKYSSKISICSDEVISNIIFYSGASHLEVFCAKVGNEAVVEFSDNGRPFNPVTDAREPNITACAEDREVGGLGIFIVKKMMNSVDYLRIGERNVLRMSLKLL